MTSFVPAIDQPDNHDRSLFGIEADPLTPEATSYIEGAIAKLQELRFVFEHDGNLAALQRLQDELLTELDLLDTTKWSVQHQRVNAIFSPAPVSTTVWNGWEQDV